MVWLPHLLPEARWFIHLVRDDGPRPKDPAALQAMQDAHIGNLGKRYDEGKFVAAGPVTDPTKHRRGIVIAGVGTKQEVMACFVGDPYIDHKIMRVEAHRWKTPVSGFHPVTKDAKMAEYRLVRVHLPADYRGHFPSFPGAFGGAFAGESLGVLIVLGSDDTAVRASLDASEAVRAGATYDVIPLYMAAGVVG